MADRPYIVYPDTARQIHEVGLEQIVIKGYIDEPGLLSFGTVDFMPGWFISPHSHYTWELIIVGASSAGPGYTFFDKQWWRVDPGGCLFVPKGYPHCWSAGNETGFKMLWIYPAAHKEADRIWDGDPKTFRAITPEEERNALVWTEETARSVLDSNQPAQSG